LIKSLTSFTRDVRVLALVVACIGIFAAPGIAFAQNISVRGNTRIEADSIRQYFIPAPGERLTQAKIDQGVKDLYGTGLFSNVRVTRSGGGITVTVSENSVINRVRFEGNSQVNTETLTSEIQSRSRGPYSQAMIDADLERLKEVYRRAGRSAAVITVKTAPAASGRTDVTFVVDEGDKTGVAEIRFIGNNAVTAWRLKRLMTTTEMNFLSWLKNSDIYDPERIAADLELIRRYYLKNGYADFRVISSNAQFDATEGGYIVEIVLEEGEQYRVSTVDVESRIADVAADDLRGAVETGAGDIYNADAVEQSIDGMSSVVQRKGYAFAQVRPRGDRDPVNKTIGIVYSVEQGPRVFIERINIRGNTRTQDYVIRREFDVAEGDAYNRFLIDRAERRLRNLGFFRAVRITNEQGSSPDRVIINVDVLDQPTGSFSFAGGYSTTDGIIGEVALEETNFLGRGQNVRASVTYGQRTQGFDLGFTEPFFLGQRIAAGFDAYSRFNDNVNIGYYESRLIGGAVRFGFPLSEYLTVGAKYSLFNQDITVPAAFRDNDLTNGEATLPIKELAAANGVLTSMVTASLTYNSLDNVQSPSSGIYATANLDIAGLAGDSYFARLTADARYFYPLFDDIVAIGRVQGGHIASLNGDPLQITDHFNLGPNLVRGFAPSGIGPRDTSNLVKGALGATTYFGGSFELQAPVPALPAEFGMKLAAFVDVGTAFGYDGKTTFVPGGNLSVFDDNKLRSSVGVGLLWASPLGPIRFDYAYVLSKANGDQTQAFRFQGGTRF
jgi:outer membrane protein insertion porin family